MRTFKITVFMLSFFSIISTQAQELFKVMATKGGSQFAKTASLNDKKNIVTGQKLFTDDNITMPAGAYLALVHKSGKTIELKQAGTFNVNDISAKVAANNVSFNQKYSEYVLNELTKGEKADIKADHQSHMNVTGSVERGGESLKAYLPIKSDILELKSSISWAPVSDVKGTKTYSIKFSNMFDEVLYSTTTTDTTYNFDLSTMKLGEDKSVIVEVSLKENPERKCTPRFINIISGTKSIDLKSKEQSVLETIGNDPNSSLNAFLIGSFYDDNNLYIEASSNYQRAIKLEPEVSEYSAAYNDLLIKSGVVTEKKK